MSTWGTAYDNMVSGLQSYSHALARLQEQVASGSRVLRASDAPTDAFRIMDLQARVRTLESYEENLAGVVGDSENSLATLQSLSGTLAHVGQLLTQASSGTFMGQRSEIAQEFDSILEGAVAFANKEILGRHLFSGESTDVEPYVVEREDGRIISVSYQGSRRNLSVPVAAGLEYPATLVGEDIFASNDPQEPRFLGSTGAKAGLGTSTVRGDVWMTVVHDTTTYGGATGVAAGSSSADGDTVIGSSHKLIIDVDNSTVRLEDGQSRSYDTGTDDNLRLENVAGDVVYVDMTGLVGGLSGTVEVAITATGKLSIDDLASTVDLTAFSTNETVTDSRTGGILYVDATGVRRTGLEPVRVQGTYDLFGTLIGIRDLLLNERGLTNAEQQELLAEVSDSLGEVHSGLVGHIASLGGQVQAMSSVQRSMDDIKFHTETRLAGLSDADVVQLAADLARTQTYYQMLLAATAKTLGLSLLDFI